METTGSTTRFCTRCGHANPLGDRTCARCGQILTTTLRRGSAPRSVAPPFRPTPRGVPGPVTDQILGMPTGIFYLLTGIPIALLLGLAGSIAFMGWFLTSLVHELGHCAVALFFGSFAVPAIRLDGHAAAVHSCPSTFVIFAIWAALAGLAWHFRSRRGWLVTFAIAAALYPLFAFTRGKELLHLVGGHLGELAFATVFFWRALTGGFVKQTAERPFYAGLGWLWTGGAILLFGSLMLSEASRQWYLANGSFGLQNDLVRLAGMFRVSLPAVAAPMLLVSLAPLPLALYLSRHRR